MRRQQGPTKRLAPSPSPETSCPHEYVQEDDLVLCVDCNACPGAHDLCNQRCFAGVLNIMTAGAEPDSIILMRYVHRRYRGDAVRAMVSAATELSALRRSMASVIPSSDRKCRTCPASPHRILLQAKLRLMENPMSPRVNRRDLAGAILESVRGEACEKVSDCVSRVLLSTAVAPG